MLLMEFADRLRFVRDEIVEDQVLQCCWVRYPISEFEERTMFSESRPQHSRTCGQEDGAQNAS